MGWGTEAQSLHRRLRAARTPLEPRTVDFRELDRLPAPVQRYLRAVLRDGQPMVTAAHVRHEGTLNMGQGRDRWRSFTSNQLVVTRRPGFDWDARIALLPGLAVRVHDAYVAGEGMLQVRMLGLFRLVDLRDGGALAEGELMRFLAEGTWYPTALLPSQGVRWTAVDESSARATLTDDRLRVSLLYQFDEHGLVDVVRAEDRGRIVGATSVPTPWEGRFSRYAERGGMRVPLEGEVAWILPQGPRPYWRGRITRIDYETSP